MEATDDDELGEAGELSINEGGVDYRGMASIRTGRGAGVLGRLKLGQNIQVTGLLHIQGPVR